MSVFDKVSLAVAGVLVLLCVSLAVYAMYERDQAQALRADNAVEKLNTVIAQQAATALTGAINAKSTAQATATQSRAAAQSRVAAAVAASPAVASMVVPESYWVAIYGGDDAR